MPVIIQHIYAKFFIIISFVIFNNENMKVGDLTNSALPIVKGYINANYKTEKSFGPMDIMTLK